MADLSSILGGMVQGFKDFGTGLVDMFGTGGAAIGDAIESIRTGKATNKNQNDFRKWLYQTDNTQDAAAKGLGTILNGVQTVADVIPGAQAVTANPLFNGLQGAVAGVSDELKMAGKDVDWGRAAQRAGVGGASGLLSAAAGQKLQKTGNKMLSNGLTRGAVQGAIGGGIANAGYTGIEGGSVQDMINAGLYGAKTGALVGGTTGLARELIKPTTKMDAALTNKEKAARIANIDDQLAKLDTSTPEGSARYNELMNARSKYTDNRQAQFELLQKTNPMTDDYHTGIRSPEDIHTLKNIVDTYNADNNFTYPDFTLSDAQKALANGNIDVYSSKPIEAGAFISPSKMMATDYAGGGQVYSKNIPLDDFAFIESGDEGNYLPVAKKPTNVADLMAEKKTPTNVAELMTEKKPTSSKGVTRIGSSQVAPIDKSTLPKGWAELQDIIDRGYMDDITNKFGYESGAWDKLTPEQLRTYILDAQEGPNLRKGWESRLDVFEQMSDSPEEFKKTLLDVASHEAKSKAERAIESLDMPQDQKNAITYAANRANEGWKEEKRYISNYPKGAEGKKGWENNATSEADAEFSDRLGIGRSNTLKQDEVPRGHDAAGQYLPGEYTMAIQPYLNKENSVSTLAHERLHSFQFEAPEGRYDKRVIDAYNELSKDLKPFIHDKKTIQSRYKTVGNTEYWARPIEQEARMVQQYLDNKGFTKNAVAKYRQGEWGKEINPAFDKFFNTLRKLSKKGVALPALTALFGGGAIMAATQNSDKKKKSEVK